MDRREAGRYWESNALAWTRLARESWDVYRDAVNTPAFFVEHTRVVAYFCTRVVASHDTLNRRR